MLATNRNCGARYLDLHSAEMHTARVTLSQNLIECDRSDSFWDFVILANNDYLINGEWIDKLNSCDRDLIDDYNKAIRGYDSAQWTSPLIETCDNCDDFYAINLGCIDADLDVESVSGGDWSGVGIYRSNEATAFVVVDSKTGAVYW